jgi:two-component system, NtrC family, response regulator GlrR
MSRSRVDSGRSPDSAGLMAAAAGLGLVGRSPAFRAVLDLLPRLAAYDAPVLLRGETGTGKELVARALHYLSPRQGRPFVPVNCGALPETLLESELFGHVRGAFTDARLDRPGLVAMAEGGTLFLDEVDSLSPKGQVALLRFLQDHEYRQVGGQRLRKADVRVLAATNVDLARRVADGQFRQDLLFRLDVLAVELPPLARRAEDIPLLARHFLARFASQYDRAVPTIEAPALAWLAAQPWPGNVRELENVMHRALLLAENGRVALPPPSLPVPEPALGTALYGGGLRQACAKARWDIEDRYLRELIALTAGNVSEAARRAGIERRAMGRLLKKHGIGRGALKRANP